jgi:Lysozyme like domain
VTTYSYAQLQQLWISAGGSRVLAPLAAGIAIVESGGNPLAHNPSGASGLWQIEVPLHDSAIPGGAANVFNAQANARAAVAVASNSLAGLTSNWLAFEPPGAAQAIVSRNGGTPPATGALPPAAGGAGGAGAGGTGAGGTGTGAGTGSSAAGGTGSGGGTVTLLAATGNPVSDVGSILSGVMKDFPGGNLLGEALQGVGRLNHMAAVMIDRGFSLFLPGQGFRAVFWAATGLLGISAYKTWRSGESASGDGNPHLPLAILLTGAAILAGFLAFRPWPVSTAGRPIKPGAYLWEIEQGKTPPPGAPTYTPAEVQETEAGLDILLGFWAIHQLAGTVYDIAEASAAAKSAVLGWWGNLF